jgi:DNA-binding NarL/FixJ family response regulator
MYLRIFLSFSITKNSLSKEDGPSRRVQMKVFIADDSRAVVKRLADLLEEVPGADLVGQAGDVAETVRGVQKSRPDVLILDLQMPGGTGLDVLRAIRVDHPHLCVLICTNYPYPQVRVECFAAGANFFLDKSAEFEKIPAILRELIHSETKTSPVRP